MRRSSFGLALLCGCALALACCGVSRAAPCYGSRMPHKKQFLAGGQSYFVLDRDLEGEAGSESSRQHFFLLSFGLQEWLSLDLKGGTGDITHESTTGVHTAYPEYMGGGYGLRLRWYDTEKVKGVLGFQHISVHPHTVSVAGQKNKAVSDDWQFSLLASYDFSWIAAYAGWITSTGWIRCATASSLRETHLSAP